MKFNDLIKPIYTHGNKKKELKLKNKKEEKSQVE